MFFVNVPFLVLRLILWHGHKLDVSVLLAKNALAIVMGIIEIMEFFGEQRPRKCEVCSKTFAKVFFKSHLKTCSPDGNLEMIAQDKTRNENLKQNTPQEPLKLHDTMHNDSFSISPTTLKTYV